MQLWRRPSFGEVGPLGGDNPLVSPEGRFVLDVIFTTPITNAGLVFSNSGTLISQKTMLTHVVA
jgi:ribose 5-phosphate isomerase A